MIIYVEGELSSNCYESNQAILSLLKWGHSLRKNTGSRRCINKRENNIYFLFCLLETCFVKLSYDKKSDGFDNWLVVKKRVKEIRLGQ